MKKNIYIFALALGLLFLSSCGKNDDQTDDILLSELNNPKIVKTTSSAEKISDECYSSNTETEIDDENLRPVIVTVLENGLPSRGATAKIRKTGKRPVFWSAKTDKKGIAKIFIPAERNYFQVTALKDNFAIVSYRTNRLAKGTTPVYIELNLNEQGIVITARLISKKEIDDKDVSARIISEKYTDRNFINAATSTICDDNEIIFPPVKKGLKRLRIKVKTKGFAESYSDYFNTVDDENKIVDVNLLAGVKFNGKIVRSDGEIITNFHFRATPRGQYEKNGQPGHINERVSTDNEGNFEIDGLLPEHYKFNLRTSEAQSITTNVVLYSDEDNYMEFILPKLKYQNVKGIVIYEQSGEPAEGIEVKCVTWNNKKLEIKTVTDENGNFNLSVPVVKNANANLIVNEDGFAQVKRSIRRYAGETITLLLRETGILTGTITTEAGEPISKVRVSISPEYNHSSRSSRASFSSRNSRREDISAYRVQSNPTDINGIYIISNAAAPQVYTISTWGNKEYFLPQNDNRKVKIQPGKTTVYDLTMVPKPVVMVKLKDKKGNPVLKYSLKIKTTYKNGSSRGTRNVNLSDENEWYRAELWSRKENMKLSLIAETDDGEIAVQNNIPIKRGEEYKFILTLSNSVQPDVAGFIYNSDMTPYIDGYIWGHANGKFGNDSCDYLGFFEITGMNVEKGTKIKLTASGNNISFITNVLAGDDNIEWILPEPNKIIGRVYVENINTPVTNFALSIRSTYNKKSFYSENGSFSLPVHNFHLKQFDKIKLYVFVPGYAPEIREIEFGNNKTFDVGDIIVMNKPAEIIGRVIDHEDNPVSANISLTITKNSYRNNNVLNCRTDENGLFKFTDLPPDTYQVSAYTRLKSVSSEKFELRSGETYTLPDLIIVETNAVDVLFEFVLPDGSPAANARISYFNKSTDENGFIKEKMRPGKHDNWSVNIDDDLYNTEKFEIKNDTEEITVKLIQIPSIKGTATLDGKPLNSAFLYFQRNKNYYSASVFDGKFELKAKPGKYIVTCTDKKVAAVVELKESGENKIDFNSGTAAFEFAFSIEGNWNISLSTKIDGKNINIANYNSVSDDDNKVTKLPAGEYKISAYCRNDNFNTNISTKATLSSGETKKIKF